MEGLSEVVTLSLHLKNEKLPHPHQVKIEPTAFEAEETSSPEVGEEASVAREKAKGREAENRVD